MCPLSMTFAVVHEFHKGVRLPGEIPSVLDFIIACGYSIERSAGYHLATLIVCDVVADW